MSNKSPSPPHLALPTTRVNEPDSRDVATRGVPIAPRDRGLAPNRDANDRDSLQGLSRSPIRSPGLSPALNPAGSVPRSGSPAMSSSSVEVMLAARARRRSSNSAAARPKLGNSGVSSAANSPRLAPISGTPPKPLNTHSPVALAAAAAVTPEKIARLLRSQGPLAIRHITSHLATTIPGFGDLSLSKQRRLIIAVLDNGDSSAEVAFDKVGWGRWAVRESGDESKPGAPAAGGLRTAVDGTFAIKQEHYDARERRGTGSFSNRSRITLRHLLSDTDRRDSISHGLPDHKLPLSPQLVPTGSRSGDVVLDGADLYKRDTAVFSDSDEEDQDDRHDTDEEDWQSMGPPSLRAASPREQEAIAALVQLRSI